ncbi:MAG TPA: Ada metal-binding domain-containing protein [Gammaproteobacteria bacterium]
MPSEYPFDRSAARDGRFDGRFLVGVLSTGIYCLPSCPARAPRAENVRLVADEAEAQALGLRPCKRCRPDLFYRGESVDEALFDALAARVRAAPETFTDTAALARAAGVSASKLADLLRTHAHLSPAAWLRRERVRAACGRLLATDERVVDVGAAAGFESESAFHRQFLAVTRMTPGAYRALRGASVFMLQLPPHYRPHEILEYHARDPEGVCERADGRRLAKALDTPDGPAVLEMELERDVAWCRVHAGRRLGPEAMALLHAAALRMLGLCGDVATFEARAARDARMAALVAKRRGLRLPLSATGFDALCWAIVGQQINVRFATALRRELIELAGERVDGMRTHPTAERVASLDAGELTRRRYSRSKAEYLIGAAQAVAAGTLDAERLGEGSAVTAERRLMALGGVGTWTARYVLMRGAGFADCAPVGDVALAAALGRLHGRTERPAPREVEALMRPFTPHRSLATLHLWASLKDPT